MRQRISRRYYYEVFAFSAVITCSLQLLVVVLPSSSNGLVIFPSSIGFLGGRSLRMRKRAIQQQQQEEGDHHPYDRAQHLFASVPKDVSSTSGSKKTTNWSKTANGRVGGKKNGARSRVKSVLEKARRRTKIDTSCDWEDGASTIASAASMGGFEIFEEIDFIDYNDQTDYYGGTSSSSSSVTDSYARTKATNTINTARRGEVKSPSELDLMKADTGAVVGDVSNVVAKKRKALPFSLPTLSKVQEEQLRSGERIQYQKDMGREGSGYVVLDVDAPSDVVWDCLLDFHSYPELIPTVREIKMFTNTHLDSDYRSENPIDYEDGTLATLKHGVPSTTRAAFTLSKFRLNIAAIHRYTPHPNGDYMIFTLDPACTNVVLQSAKGIWHTQDDPYGDGSGKTRVWLLCEVKVSRILPIWITDYAAKRAMPRATSWLRPQVEAAAKLWLKKRT